MSDPKTKKAPTVDQSNAEVVKDVRLRPDTEHSPTDFFEDGELASSNEVSFSSDIWGRHKVDIKQAAGKVAKRGQSQGKDKGIDV